METEKKVFYRIGEIAEKLNVNTSLLRYWEKEFHQFIQPRRNNRGNRVYTQKNLEIFSQIHTLVKIQKLTLKGAKEKLRNNGMAYSSKIDVIRSLSEIKQLFQDIKKLLK